MERRRKDLLTMAEQAGLSPAHYEVRGNRATLLCVADNGAERRFSLSVTSRSDPRGDQNELSAMKRFARENTRAEPTAPPTITTKRATLTMPKAPAPQPAAAEELPPVTFYRVCEWLKAQTMANFPNLEALALQAALHTGTAIPEGSMKLAMDATGTQEPEHWRDPTDPQAIVVRELGRVMKSLGEKPSPAFERLTHTLLPGQA